MRTEGPSPNEQMAQTVAQHTANTKPGRGAALAMSSHQIYIQADNVIMQRTPPCFGPHAHTLF